MKAAAAFTLLVFSFFCVPSARADFFGSDENTFEIPFVTVGNPGNEADTTGLPNPAGTVDYVYRMGVYEISEDMIDKANALGGLGITHTNRSPAQPATSVSWFEAALFINWLNTSTGSEPAYKFDEEGNFQVWESGDAGYDPDNLYRNSLARYFFPSTHEWYKAAYYDPVAEVYYDFPTGSNSIPDGFDEEDDPVFDAVFYDGDHNPAPNDANNVGIPSPYGTRGQGGNVAEWIESAEAVQNGQPSTGRHVRGGQWDDTYVSLRPDIVGGGAAATGYAFVGFRVASAANILLGDISGDGQVDIGDFTLWGDAFGDTGMGLPADLSGDDRVDIGDFTIWGDNFGNTLGVGGGGVNPHAVPEPSGLAQALVGVVGLALLVLVSRAVGCVP